LAFLAFLLVDESHLCVPCGTEFEIWQNGLTMGSPSSVDVSIPQTGSPVDSMSRVQTNREMLVVHMPEMINTRGESNSTMAVFMAGLPWYLHNTAHRKLMALGTSGPGPRESLIGESCWKHATA
jgi:hypothetical protein